MAIAKATLRTVHTFVADRVAFNCNGTLTGNSDRIGPFRTGRMPAPFAQLLCNDRHAADLFVVYSYATPIAWFANGEWKLPMVKYSVTTSRHLSATRINWNAVRQLSVA